MQLNNSKAKKILNWRAKLNINETIDFVVEWYKNFNFSKDNIFNISQKQILEFMEKNMKVIILAGGLGTRMSEYTKTIPKPMVKIKKKPIIVHIMEHYYSYGFKDFIIAGGYKSRIIKDYFKKKINMIGM